MIEQPKFNAFTLGVFVASLCPMATLIGMLLAGSATFWSAMATAAVFGINRLVFRLCGAGRLANDSKN